jgi:hypothetical protein
VGKCLALLLQHRGIRDRLALAGGPVNVNLGKRAGRAAAAPPACDGQPVESIPDLTQLRLQPLVLGGQLPVLLLKGLVGGDYLGDLVDNRLTANRPLGAPAPDCCSTAPQTASSTIPRCSWHCSPSRMLLMPAHSITGPQRDFEKTAFDK